MYGDIYSEVVVVKVQPKYALICAEVLRDYCKQNFNYGNGERCQSCIFSYPGKRSCYLSMFIGVDGKEMQDIAQHNVDERFKDEIRRRIDNRQ